MLDVEAARQLAPERAAGNVVALQAIDGEFRIGTGFGEAVAVRGHTMGEGGDLDANLRSAPLAEAFRRMEAQLERQPGAAHGKGRA